MLITAGVAYVVAMIVFYLAFYLTAHEQKTELPLKVIVNEDYEQKKVA